MRRMIMLIFTLLPLVTLAGTPSKIAGSEFGRTQGGLQGRSPQTVVLDVQNMSCALCPITVKKALEKVPGVADAEVDFDRKTATVTFDSDQVNSDALIKATTDAGYPSTLRPMSQK